MKVKQQKSSSLITACGCELLLKEKNKQQKKKAKLSGSNLCRLKMIIQLSEVTAANDILSYFHTKWTTQKSHRPVITHLEDAH